MAAPSAGRGARLRRLRAFASYAWPVASLLVLVPLYRLGRLLADEKTVGPRCLLYVFVPAVDLITLHTDQAFFPLLFTLPLVLAAEAGRRGSFWLGAAAGVAAFLSPFGSFGLAPVVPLAAVRFSFHRRSSSNAISRFRGSTSSYCSKARCGEPRARGRERGEVRRHYAVTGE